MKTNLATLFVVPVVLALSANMALADQRAASWLNIKFTGDSTLHGFSGTLQQGDAIKATFGDRRDRVRITVPVLGLDTDHAARDKRMYKMFESDTFNDITGEADYEVVLDESTPDVPLTMTIHGVSREVIARRMPATNDTVALEFDLSLAAFDLKPPSVIGLIRVSDNVHVAVSLDRRTLEQLNQQPVDQKELN